MAAAFPLEAAVVLGGIVAYLLLYASAAEVLHIIDVALPECNGGLRLVGTESRKRKQDTWAIGEVESYAAIHFGVLGQMNTSRCSRFSSHSPWSFLICKLYRSHCSAFPVSEEVFAEKRRLFSLL